jgi:uncharacterized membrane protein
MSSDPTSWLHTLTLGAFAIHIGGGFVALVCGAVALVAAKGGTLHRAAGVVFVVSMMVMGSFAAYLAVVVPDQLVNVFGGVFSIYLVATAWLAAHNKRPGVGEVVALGVAVLLFAPFALLSFQLATGLAPLFRSAVPFRGPVLIAMYSVTVVLAIAVVSDARLVLFGGVSGVGRISRHLWRMCLGLTMATGSAFTNGFARLLPGPYHVPAWFFYPQFIPLMLLIFWMIRVRFKGWLSRAPIARPA